MAFSSLIRSSSGEDSWCTLWYTGQEGVRKVSPGEKEREREYLPSCSSGEKTLSAHVTLLGESCSNEWQLTSVFRLLALDRGGSTWPSLRFRFLAGGSWWSWSSSEPLLDSERLVSSERLTGESGSVLYSSFSSSLLLLLVLLVLFVVGSGSESSDSTIVGLVLCLGFRWV